MPKTIGILGGMGPEATADLLWRIVRLTPASCDQEHPRILVDSNPRIPDRTAAITGTGESPLPMLLETARGLERAGAELIVIPCNSAHHWYDEIAAAVRVPVLHMIRLAATETLRLIASERQRDGAGSSGEARPAALLLATSGTVASGTYQRAFDEAGLSLVVPGPAEQAQVMDVIYSVKAGERARARPLALDVLSREVGRLSPACVVLGCTELPLVLHAGDVDIPMIDSTEVLAREAVLQAVGRLRG